MTQNPQEDTPVIYPVLSYRNAAAAMAWLERAFGFKKVMEVPTPDESPIPFHIFLGFDYHINV
jgi:uncharacterized glyoxalase superfamily protein PhnB